MTYSPDGKFETIRKTILEDSELSPAEFRLLMYLVAKPDGWQAHDGQLADALPTMTKHAIRYGLQGLRDRGYLIKGTAVRVQGKITQGGSVLDRAKVLAGQNLLSENPQKDIPTDGELDKRLSASAEPDTHNPRSEPFVGITTEGFSYKPSEYTNLSDNTLDVDDEHDATVASLQDAGSNEPAKPKPVNDDEHDAGFSSLAKASLNDAGSNEPTNRRSVASLAKANDDDARARDRSEQARTIADASCEQCMDWKVLDDGPCPCTLRPVGTSPLI